MTYRQVIGYKPFIEEMINLHITGMGWKVENGILFNVILWKWKEWDGQGEDLGSLWI